MSDARHVDLPEGVLVVRRGPGANCSSIGSVVDLLFGAAVVGGAIWAGILASLKDASSSVPAPAPSRPDAAEDE